MWCLSDRRTGSRITPGNTGARRCSGMLPLLPHTTYSAWLRKRPNCGRTPSVLSQTVMPRQVKPAHCSASVVSGSWRQSVNRQTGAPSLSSRAHSVTLTETGRTGEAQGILLGELEKRYKGTAAAARDTLGGALTALKNSFDNLLEGDSGDAGVRGARDAIESFNDTLNDPGVKRGVNDLVGGLATIASAAAKAISLFGELNQKQMETFGFTRQSLGRVFVNIMG